MEDGWWRSQVSSTDVERAQQRNNCTRTCEAVCGLGLTQGAVVLSVAVEAGGHKVV